MTLQYIELIKPRFPSFAEVKQSYVYVTALTLIYYYFNLKVPISTKEAYSNECYD